MLDQRRDDVLVERLADGGGVLAPVEDRERLHRLRQRCGERGAVERPVEPHLQHADLLAARLERRDGLLDRAGAGAHQHDDALGVRRADVVEQPVAAPGQLGEPFELGGDDPGYGRVVRVRRLARLEEDVGVLRRAAHDGMVRGERARAMRGDEIVVDERAQVVVAQRLDHVHLVRGAEAVEEVEERDARAERRGRRDRGEVVRLLHVGGAEQREAGAARGHDVAVVAEDRERVRRDRARGDVHDERRQLAGDLEHVREHQEQALRRRERRRQRARLERAVHGACRAGLRLHLDDPRDVAPEVRLALRRPLVRELAHRRCGGDRVDGDDLARLVRDEGRGFVPVHHEALFGHEHSLAAARREPHRWCLPDPLGTTPQPSGAVGSRVGVERARDAPGRAFSGPEAQTTRRRA